MPFETPVELPVEMRVVFDRSRAVLDLRLANRSAARDFFAAARGEGGFLVSLEAELRFRDAIEVRVRTDDGFELSFTGEVSGISKTRTGDYATAILLTRWGLTEDEQLGAALASGGSTAAQVPTGRLVDEAPAEASSEEAETEEVGGTRPEAPRPVGEARGASPMHRIRTMNPNQRTVLARKADRVERQILLNDTSPQVLQALLANPRIEGKDVLRMVKSTHAAAPMLKRIAEDPRWGKNQEILAVIAKNPKTPAPQAVRLVEKLRTSDLRWMAKMSSGVRETVRRAALREYLRRTGS